MVRQYGPCGETVVAETVPVVRLMSAKKTVPRSDYRDTYSIPGGEAPKGRKPADSAVLSDCAVPNDETTADTVPQHRERLVWTTPVVEEAFGDEAERLRAAAINGVVVLDGDQRVNGINGMNGKHTPRAEWLATTKSRGEKPWLAEGLTRRTWYRRRQSEKHSSEVQ